MGLHDLFGGLRPSGWVCLDQVSQDGTENLVGIGWSEWVGSRLPGVLEGFSIWVRCGCGGLAFRRGLETFQVFPSRIARIDGTNGVVTDNGLHLSVPRMGLVALGVSE